MSGKSNHLLLARHDKLVQKILLVPGLTRNIPTLYILPIVAKLDAYIQEFLNIYSKSQFPNCFVSELVAVYQIQNSLALAFYPSNAGHTIVQSTKTQ